MKEYLEENRMAYNELAIQYKKRRDNKSRFEEDVEVLGGAVLEFINRRVQNPVINVLEIGPGSGQILEYFERKNCRTLGIELSEEMANIAKEYSPRSIIINADVNSVNFLENQMDIVYIGATIHLFPRNDASKVLDKMYKSLKKDGILFINTTIHENTCEGYFVKGDYTGNKERYRVYWSETDFERFVIKKGFKVLKKMYTDENDRKKRWLAFICRKEGTDE